jgi:magnesium chelatase family protein
MAHAGVGHPRIARTIADLEEAPDVTATHLAEAVQYRRLDRNLFA